MVRSLLSQSNFAALMQAITGCQSSLSTLTTKIDTVQLEIGLIRQDFEKVRQRVMEVERRVGDTEDTVKDHSASLHTLQVRVKHLESRAEDSENCNRCNNLRTIGLPEGSEGSDPSAYTERLLQLLFPQAAFSPYFAVERAHRMPPARGPPPRTFIFRLLNFRDSDMILCEARKMAEICHKAARLMFFPDFSVDTQKLRKSFDSVKQALRVKGVRYSMLFPARLRVQDSQSVCFFTSLAEASQWLNTLPRH